MKILGEDGVGKLLKKFLQICFVAGIIILIFLPIELDFIGLRLTETAIVIYPNGIALLAIAYQFIGLFDSLKNNNPFCQKNVIRLKNAGNASIMSAIFWTIDLLLAIFLIEYSSIVVILVFTFMIILFTGVAISLYILAELIRQGAEYKEENELTI